MGWDTVIWIGIAVVVTAGSAIGNWMKQRAEREQAQKAADRRRHAAGSTGSGDLDDVASRRREQLRQMSQQRQTQGNAGRAGATSGGTSGGGEPTNLTMAERIARARAKAQYEQRAEGLRDRGRSESARTARPAEESPAAATSRREQAELEARRRQQVAQRDASEARAREQQRRAAQQAQQRQRQQAAQRQQQLAQQQAATLRRQRELQSMAVAEDHGPIDAGESVVHRHVPDAEALPVPELIQAESVSLSKMNRASWRRAIILKEVIDRPVALREFV